MSKYSMLYEEASTEEQILRILDRDIGVSQEELNDIGGDVEAAVSALVDSGRIDRISGCGALCSKEYVIVNKLIYCGEV